MTFSIEVDPSVATVPESEELADEAVALDDELPDDDPEFDVLPPHPVRRVDTVTNDISIRDKIFFFILFAPFHIKILCPPQDGQRTNDYFAVPPLVWECVAAFPSAGSENCPAM